MIRKIEGLLKLGEPVFSDMKRINRYEIIKMVLQDLPVTVMADKLGVSRKTIFWHFQKIKLEFDLGRVSTAGKYRKEQFKAAIKQQGFRLDMDFEGARVGLPPVPNFIESVLPRGL